MKLKRPKLISVKPTVAYEPASPEDLKRYDRMEKRWAHSLLKEKGLFLRDITDKRIIEFLDLYKASKKNKKKGISLHGKDFTEEELKAIHNTEGREAEKASLCEEPTGASEVDES